MYISHPTKLGTCLLLFFNKSTFESYSKNPLKSFLNSIPPFIIRIKKACSQFLPEQAQKLKKESSLFCRRQ